MSQAAVRGLYKIKTIASLAGLNPTILRAWERRYGILEPVRTATGHRLYTADDLKLLKRVKALISEGRSIGEIVMLGRAALLNSAPATPASRPGPAPQLETGPGGEDAEFLRMRQTLVRAALELDEPGLQTNLDRAFGAVSACQAIQKVLVPAAREIGSLWASGRATVASEHLMSAVFSRRIHKLIEVESAANGTAGEVLCACLPDEQHEIGALIVAYVMLRLGASVTYLGASLPLEDLEQAIHARRPRFVCLSVSRVALLEVHRSRLLDLLHRSRGMNFLLGGPGILVEQEPELFAAGAQLWPIERPLSELRPLLATSSL